MQGAQTATVGLVCNLLLSVTKIVAGVIFGSVSVLADGFNNLTDASSSGATLIGFRMAEKPADKEHPFGHARYEYIAGLIISFMTLFLGLETAIKSVEKLIGGGTTDVNVLLMALLGASIAVKCGMFVFYRITAKRLDSTSIRAAAQDSFNDCIATLAVLICAVVAYFTGVETDGYVGIAVAIFIIVNGIKLVRDTMSPLLGEKPSEELLNGITEKILSYEGISGLHDLIVHNYGHNRYFATVHAEIDASVGVITAHNLIDEIERGFAASGISLVIHLDPIETDEKTERIKRMVKEILADTDGEITLHDFRLVVKDTAKFMEFDVAAPYALDMDDEELKRVLERKISSVIPGHQAIITVDRF